MTKRFLRLTLCSMLLSAVLAGCAARSVDNGSPTPHTPDGAGEYNYAKLQTRSLDDMNAVVRRQLQKAKKFTNEDDTNSAVAALQAAAQYTLSRPDRDNLVSKVIAPVRTELKELNSFETTMQNIVAIAIKGLNNTSLKPSDRGTYYFVLINFMSEFKPDLKMNPQMRKAYEAIEKANIKVDGKVENDLKLRAMNARVKSPSELAASLLKSVKTQAPTFEKIPDDLEGAPL